MGRKMKDSGVDWIGKIPEEWTVVRIKHQGEYRNGISYKPEDVSDEGVIVMRACNVKKGRIVLNDMIRISREVKDEMMLKSGDILICSCNGSIELVGKNALIENNSEATFGAFMMRLRTKEPKYMYYILNSGIFSYYINSYKTSTINQLTSSNFGGMKIPMCYNSAERQKIENHLDTKCAEIDKVVEKTRESMEEYKKLKQAVITEAVTKGVRGSRPMKPSGVEWIGDIPAEWEIFSLRYIGSCQNGISKGGEYFGQGYPFISYSDVYKNITLPTSPTGLVETTTEEQKRYSVQCGDIFFTRTSETIEEIGIASVCCSNISCATFAGFLIRVRPYNAQILPHYSKYYFRSEIHRRFFVKEMNIVTRASLSQDLLKRMPVLLPDRNEQQEIADYLDAKCGEIDRLISKKEQLIAELEAYKKSLIYEYVTGKKEVSA